MMIYIIGIAITFFLAFILLTKKNKSLADKILAIWLFAIGLHLTLFYFFAIKKHLQLPHILGFEIPMPLLHGPFLFLYTISLTNPNKITRKSFLHFIPYILGLLLVGPFFILSPEEKIDVYANEGINYATLIALFFVSFVISGILYSFLSLRALIFHHKSILEIFSYTEKINLRWLYFLVIGLGLIWILVIFADDHYIFSTVVLYVLFIGFFGIKQVGVFTNQPPSIISSASENTALMELYTIPSENSKYSKSTLTDSQLETIHRELLQLMKSKKLYLTPELTLTMVSQELNVHPNTLSQVINALEQKNFFDYVNSLRVEEFKERVAVSENQKYTLLSLAHDCGFNSKTSFNRNFKNVTGKSPSEYLKEIKITLN